MSKQRDYVIFTDPSSDLAPEDFKRFGLGEFRMGLLIGDPVNPREVPASIVGDDYTISEFYGWLRNNENIRTAQVTTQEFEAKMEEVLKQGKDLLYIACSSALSGSVNLGKITAQEMMYRYPDRKVVVIDSLCSSLSLGALVYHAGVLQEEGKSMDEVIKWVEDHREYSNQYCTIDTLKFMKKTGRVTGAAAFFGDIFQVKPIIISNLKGENFAFEKVKGKKKALAHIAQRAFDSIEEGQDVKDAMVFVGHGDDPETAEIIVGHLKALGFEKIHVSYIGPIVGTTCGPGVVATFIVGKRKLA